MHAILPCYTCIFMTSTTFLEDLFLGLNLALLESTGNYRVNSFTYRKQNSNGKCTFYLIYIFGGIMFLTLWKIISTEVEFQ